MIFFQSCNALLQVFVSAIIVYVALVLFLRISGKRTLSQMNIFDFVITVAFGSTMASTIISKDAVVLDGLLALASLILLQFLVAQTSVRWPRFQRLVKSQPRILYHHGQYDTAAMHKERIAKEEIRQAMRSQGVLIEEQVEAVVLETNGKFSVLKKSHREGTSTIREL
jgi:uncharacterized membrane protein YcaP (DUF421 family)